MPYEQLVNLLKQLSSEFHQIVNKSQVNKKPDGIMFSISITIDNALVCVSSHASLTPDVMRGIEKANAVAVKSFEGTGLDDDLFTLQMLAEEYQKYFTKE